MGDHVRHYLEVTVREVGGDPVYANMFQVEADTRDRAVIIALDRAADNCADTELSTR
jgi:hypothetical protein